MTDTFIELEIKSIHDKLNAIAERVEEVARQDDMRLMNIQDIAIMLGLAPKSLYRKPWLLPNYGRTGGKMMWTKKEVKAWLDKGAETLFKEYRQQGIEKALEELTN